MKRGILVNGIDYPAEKVSVGYGQDLRIVRLTVLPSNWHLPRTFRFQDSENGRLLQVDQGSPPQKDDNIIKFNDHEWHITLKWSKEAIAQAAYEMTFWYMGKIGEVVYSKSIPNGWEDMTPYEAGQNAIKMMLYYAIQRSRNIREEQRSIALYNVYCFGYALGTSFMNKKHKREMLWIQDLDEILSEGKNKNECAFR